MRYVGPKNENADLATQVDVYGKAQTIDAKTGAYTFVTGDAGKIVTGDFTTATTFTVNGSLDLLVGQRIDVIQTNTGQITIAGSGATVNGTPGLKLRARYSAATLICVAADSYILIGDLTA